MEYLPVNFQLLTLNQGAAWSNQSLCLEQQIKLRRRADAGLVFITNYSRLWVLSKRTLRFPKWRFLGWIFHSWSLLPNAQNLLVNPPPHEWKENRWWTTKQLTFAGYPSCRRPAVDEAEPSSPQVLPELDSNAMNRESALCQESRKGGVWMFILRTELIS